MGKPEDWSELDKYKEEKPKKKKGFFAELLDKTVIPEKIRKYKEEKRAKEELHHQAKMEAMAEVKDDMKAALKEKYKQEEIDKLTGAHREKKLKKFADAFSLGGTGLGSTDKIERMLGKSSKSDVDIGSDEKIDRMLGAGRKAGASNQDIERMMGSGRGYSNEQIERTIAPKKKPKKKKVKEKKVDEFENRIKRMLS